MSYYNNIYDKIDHIYRYYCDDNEENNNAENNNEENNNENDNEENDDNENYCWINLNPTCKTEISFRLLNDKEQIEKLIFEDYKKYKLINDDLKKDKDFFKLIFCKINYKIFKYAHKDIIEDEIFIMKLMTISNSFIFKYLPQKMKNKFIFYKKAVFDDIDNIKYMNENENITNFLESYIIKYYKIDFKTIKLKSFNTKEKIMFILKKKPFLFYFLPGFLFFDIETIFQALKYDHKNYKFINYLNNDDKILLNLILNNNNNEKYNKIFYYFLNDINRLKKNQYFLKFIRNFKPDEDFHPHTSIINELLIDNNSNLIIYVMLKYLDTDYINKFSFCSIGENLKKIRINEREIENMILVENKKQFLKMIYKNTQYGNYISNELKNDYELNIIYFYKISSDVSHNFVQKNNLENKKFIQKVNYYSI